MWNCWRKYLERKYRWKAHRSRPRVVPLRRPFLPSTGRGADRWRRWRGVAIDADAAPETPSPRPREPRHTAGSARRPAKRARVVSQTRRMIGPKNRPASARPDSHLKLNTALHQLHPDFDGTRKFPRGRGIMPSFLLENIDGNDVTNENHEAFEQFVVCWLFNEIIPRTCRVPGKVDAKGVSVEVDETKPSIRVLELGGGIGAVSTMIQQNLQMVDQDAPHVVVEPNALLSDGPLLRNRLRHGSRFDVIRGVVSSKDKVAFGLGDINPNHPRAWMWGTIDSSASRKVDVRGAPLSEVEDLLGGSPTVLVADCEGGLISLLEDYPHIIDEVVAIYYERDPPGDYTASEALLAAKGFVPVLIASLHRVVVRESALPRPVKPADATMADATPAPAAAPTAAEAATPGQGSRGRAGGRDHGGHSADAGGRGDHARPQGQGRTAVAVAVANAVVLDG